MILSKSLKYKYLLGVIMRVPQYCARWGAHVISRDLCVPLYYEGIRFTILEIPLSRSAARNVLIVEDEPIVAASLKDWVTDLGCTATIAPSSQQALKQTEEFLPDLVLMDIHLGDGADGILTARMIRKECSANHRMTRTARSDTAAFRAALSFRVANWSSLIGASPVSRTRAR